MNLGTAETRDDGRQVVRFERTLAHPPERVWRALTEPGELIAWWGDADVEPAVGGRFHMRWLNTDADGNAAEMLATITRFEPPRLLETDGDMHGVLRFELEPHGDGGTLLRFSSTLELPEEFRTKVLAGWHFHLDALARALDGEPNDLVDVANGPWKGLHEQYVAALA